MKVLKGVLVLSVFVWFLGAAGSALSTMWDGKSECISHQGLLKGWLMCESDPSHLGMVGLMLRGLGWPARLFSSDEDATAK
ncbi:hypothetical protein ACUH78_16115 [Thauera sp. ZXT1-4]|uniref:hypothetical protein n=1 Tax=Thauera sp. ZXT1-4 TaxID=3460294 RepID=UPI0040409A0F